MKMAIKQALIAESKDEVPIGAVIVKDGVVLSKAYNLVERKNNPVFHAEILAIIKACKKVKGWRLNDCEMYVTVEPCAMCAGAIANARIKRVYFGAKEEKSGCATSLYPVLERNGLNHKVEYLGGVMEKECSKIIKDYFRKKRAIKP